MGVRDGKYWSCKSAGVDFGGVARRSYIPTLRASEGCQNMGTDRHFSFIQDLDLGPRRLLCPKVELSRPLGFDWSVQAPSWKRASVETDGKGENMWVCTWADAG